MRPQSFLCYQLPVLLLSSQILTDNHKGVMGCLGVLVIEGTAVSPYTYPLTLNTGGAKVRQ